MEDWEDGDLNTWDETSPVTPENTIFIEYLPTNCFGCDPKGEAEVDIMSFDWAREHFTPNSPYYHSPTVSYYRANRPQWRSMWDERRAWERTYKLIRDL